jgi:N-acetylglutamate synthase-like GNAT family acetyltransferase
MNWQQDEFMITTDATTFDIPYIHRFLSQTYWAEMIPAETVERSIRGSLCFGVFNKQQQIGFARVITDKATFAYLADVFIDEAWRGRGLSKWLMRVILGHPELQGLRNFTLRTADAHGLYRQFGFTEISDPDRWMHILRPGLYKKLAEAAKSNP